MPYNTAMKNENISIALTKNKKRIENWTKNLFKRLQNF